ncbi:unnamed protein product [Albugo candida]|uniref:Uncharacterized protein n=1 Tax=Albugo candida TaxID=65357 RepID=A0A024FXY5_9STRA|nr:unnamed protein product [Albugo candida]|eukprot:CCI11499.1 unnamed protein product [Albugo candida]
MFEHMNNMNEKSELIKHVVYYIHSVISAFVALQQDNKVSFHITNILFVHYSFDGSCISHSYICFTKSFILASSMKLQIHTNADVSLHSIQHVTRLSRNFVCKLWSVIIHIAQRVTKQSFRVESIAMVLWALGGKCRDNLYTFRIISSNKRIFTTICMAVSASNVHSYILYHVHILKPNDGLILYPPSPFSKGLCIS